ncbi:MAG TPA: sulfate ABC transporter substrate-binding protein [Solirubrobacteraceae bacterium]|nr:sulfate ABC transporter substrate-binding protein [Solirubrobacteraceae bacterium]
MNRGLRLGRALPNLKRAGALSCSLLVGGAVLAACGGSSDTSGSGGSSSSTSGGGTQLSLVAYSTPKKAYDALTAAYEQTSQGKGISFSQSFGPSGAQSRAVASGQPADVVAFSTEPDISRLVKAGMVASGWDANSYQGVPSDSVVVFVVRKGNPKHITGWDDLIKPGVDVVTPNPSTSGSARWNILAGYGAQLKEGKTPAQALAYLRTLLTKNVSVQPSSASSALQTFTGGKGDVLLDYESDAIAAKKAGDAIDYILPKQTLLIQTPIAVTSNGSHKSQAAAFVQWLYTPAAQTIWAKEGYRPVVQSVASQFSSQFPTPPELFTISSLGGWSKIDKTFFDKSNGTITKIEQAAGVPTVSS